MNADSSNMFTSSNPLTIGNSVEETLQQICYDMPKAWQYPEYAIARIVFDDKTYLSSDILPDYEIKFILTDTFETNEFNKGKVEFIYLKDFPLAIDGAYLQSERMLLNNLANMISGFINIIHEKEKYLPAALEIQKIIHDKTERQKELNCINQTSQIIKENLPINETLEKICNILPAAWQFPEFTVARVSYDKFSYFTKGFHETPWVQRKAFRTIGDKIGLIEVYYIQDFPASDEGPFMKEERNLINNLSLMISTYINITRNEQHVQETNKVLRKELHEKTERIKELECINKTTALIKYGRSVSDTLQQICQLLPKAWQYPESTTARITYDDIEYTSPRFTESRWSQKQTFFTFEEKHGSIEVFYTAKFPDLDEGPFLKEERNLIDNLTGIISNYLNSVKAKEMLNRFRQKDDLPLIEPSNDPKLNSKQLLHKFLNRHNSNRDIYHDLQSHRVKEILIIATLYDAFSIEREGRFTEHMMGEYHQLSLSSAPRVTGVSSYNEAIVHLRTKHFDLVILMKGGSRKAATDISTKIKQEYPDLPIFLLLNNNTDIAHYKIGATKIDTIDRIFVWNGDSKIFPAMVKHLEDKLNVDNDTKIGLVKTILLVEDSEKYYSRYLPMLYDKVMEQTKRLIDDVKADDLYKVLRMRARPKILLATNYEEAIEIINKFRESLICLITDVKFFRDGNLDVEAGFHLTSYAKGFLTDLPTIIQSSDPENSDRTYALNATFINKNSETLLQQVDQFIKHYLGFGDFIFRDEHSQKIGQAATMKDFERIIETIPPESLFFHGVRNHFSQWLLARGEIRIAKMIRPVMVSDFKTPEELRKYLQYILKQYRQEERIGKVINFDESAILDETNIVSLGTGALGGKGRGLAFINNFIYNLDFAEIVPEIKIRTPRTTIIGTDEFDTFLEKNGLKTIVYEIEDYNEIKRLFVKGKLSYELSTRLKTYLHIIDRPIAVRSSSLFEDSMHQPFSGIFETYLLPNNHPDIKVRFEQLSTAIKLVYASIFSTNARTYFKAINYHIEEEKMAVIIQQVVGNQFEGCFYPHISGTAQSHNFYPVAHMQPEEGVAVCAVGLGQYVVEGEKAYRFSPHYPTLEIYSVQDLIKTTQVYFYAINLNNNNINLLDGEEAGLIKLDISVAEKHGTLKHLASVYNKNNDRIDPGLDTYGPRVINFANILKYDYIPLARTIEIILDITKEAFGSAVEIEFAVDLAKDKKGLASFYLLQIKPLVGNEDDYNIDLEKINKKDILLYAEKSMGNGKVENITDVIFIDNAKFDKLRTLEMVDEIEKLNTSMMLKNRRYILIGPGRWGTRDRFIGIPVAWPQISNAKIIVEISLDDFPLDASLGSHFFHNVTSMNVGYFSVQNRASDQFIAWNVLNNQMLIEETKFFKHVRFEEPLNIIMDGRKRLSLVLWGEDLLVP